MKLLVLSQDYPDESDSQKFGYVHSRNKYYIAAGLNVLVLAFNAQKEYIFETVTVTNADSFKRKFDINLFDAIISHAPNWRNHLRFLYTHEKTKRIFFFIHGHEALKRSDYYPLPYPKFRSKFFFLKRGIVNLYDNLKLIALKNYFTKRLLSQQVKLIFVSEWMKNEFLRNINIWSELIENNSVIIYNCAAKELLDFKYNCSSMEKIKIITIRQFDNPKYAVDLVLKAANDNPQFEFHLFGYGKFFEDVIVPINLKIFNKFFDHQSMPDLLNQYTAAFMPTRLDSQGVMMCEMASYGIPLITSDLPICHEMLKGFSNVFFISNNSEKIPLEDFINSINLNSKNNKDKFSFENTVLSEIKYFNRILFGSEFVFNRDR